MYDRARRISIVTETFAPEINGVAHTLGHLCQALQSKFSIQIVHPRKKKGKLSHPLLDHMLVPGLPIPGYSQLRFGLPCYQTLISEWQRIRPDAIYVATQGPLGWSALRAARKLQIPVVSGFHTNFHRYSQHYGLGWMQPILQRYFRRFHNATLATLAPTSQTRNEISQLGITNARVWGRGVDATLFHPGQRCEKLRGSWGATASTNVFLYVGRLAQEKNVYLALQAFERARLQYPNAKMVIVGSGPLEARIARSYPQAILCGWQRGTMLARHYASADIFLFPSLTDTFGNVVLEAMASGLGIVSFRDAAAGQLLEHEASALLADPPDQESFCQQAISIAMRPSLLTRLRQEAFIKSQEFSWPQLANQFADHLFPGPPTKQRTHLPLTGDTNDQIAAAGCTISQSR